MTELTRLQDQFQAYLLSTDVGIINSVISTPAVSAQTRLDIYRDGYQLRLIECLTANFPALHRYLGTEEFEKVCVAYIATHPSSYRSIRWYGDTLPEFLKAYYGKSKAYLAELADFEWLMTLCFDAADDPQVQMEEMAAVPGEAWAGLQFKPHASLQRVNYFWNVVPLWKALVQEEELPNIEVGESSVPWVLWRAPGYVIQFYSLTEEETWALDAIMQGLSFGELCEGLCHWLAPEEVGMCAATFLKGWIQKGMLARLLIN